MSSIDYRTLRNGPYEARTFAEAIFSTKYALKTRRDNAHDEVKEVAEAVSEPIVEEQVSTDAPVLSERKEVLDSLQQFVEEEGVTKNDLKEVSFSGGKVVKQTNDFEVPPFTKEYLEDLEFYENSDISDQSVKLIFVCEKPQDIDSCERGADLLSKMIQAMNLDVPIRRLFINKDSDRASKVWKNILSYFLQHSYTQLTIVTMGAFTANLALGKKERLSKIHGKSFEQLYFRDQQKLNVTLFPLFHPDILQINPNMKRSAWIDLQKVMKHLTES